MDAQVLLAEGNELLQKYNLAEWQVEIRDIGRNSLGKCLYTKKTICIGDYYCRNNPDWKVRDTLVHEIAHALTPGHGHNAVWRAMAVQLGCIPKACNKSAEIPDGKFQATCPTCKKVYHRDMPQRINLKYFCTICGNEKGALTYQRRM